jgi:hypothetical protein
VDTQHWHWRRIHCRLAEQAELEPQTTTSMFFAANRRPQTLLHQIASKQNDYQ